jgi:hypothetical protein
MRSRPTGFIVRRTYTAGVDQIAATAAIAVDLEADEPRGEVRSLLL